MSASSRGPSDGPELPTVGNAAAYRRDPTDLALYVLDGEAGSWVCHRLPKTGQCVVGRGNGCDVVVQHPSISRRHAVIHLGPPLRVEDLNSANGTFVGSARVEPESPAELYSGDIIDLGSVTLLLQPSSRPLPQQRGDGPAAVSKAVVADEEMKRVYDLVGRVAGTPVNVLLLGETGVGKEVIAEAIHQASPRRGQRFVRLNCAAVHDALFESELFGHEKGAFSGAVAAKPGLLETAHGGTVFLDEVGELPLTLQAKMLRVVETHELLRVGALKPTVIDIRIVSATNRDLEVEVAQGRFRRDLFFRLNGVPIVIPPLRQRPRELPLLIEAFLAQASALTGRSPSPTLSAAAAEALQRHGWPGNVRELRNVLTRAVVTCVGDTIEPADLRLSARIDATAHQPPAPLPDGAAPDGERLAAELDQVERRRILGVYQKHQGNQSAAARELGISRNTLAARLRTYGVRQSRD